MGTRSLSQHAEFIGILREVAIIVRSSDLRRTIAPCSRNLAISTVYKMERVP